MMSPLYYRTKAARDEAADARRRFLWAALATAALGLLIGALAAVIEAAVRSL